MVNIGLREITFPSQENNPLHGYLAQITATHSSPISKRTPGARVAIGCLKLKQVPAAKEAEFVLLMRDL